VILYQDVTAGAAEGGVAIKLLGYGLIEQAQITIGGAPATIIPVEGCNAAGIPSYPAFRPPFILRCIGVKVPPGLAGSADITFRNVYGSVTVKDGFRYFQHQQIPNLSPSQMVLDESRGFLYVADVCTTSKYPPDSQSLTVACAASQFFTSRDRRMYSPLSLPWTQIGQVQPFFLLEVKPQSAVWRR